MTADPRTSIVEALRLFASREAQLEYERTVPGVAVPGEMMASFEDLYHPASESFLGAFTAQEVVELSEFYGRMCVAGDAVEGQALTVADACRLSEWVDLTRFAQGLHTRLLEAPGSGEQRAPAGKSIEPEKIHWHDSVLELTVESPAADALHFQVLYPVEWEKADYAVHTITFHEVFTYEIHEGPFAGKRTLLDAVVSSPDEHGARTIWIDTTAGQRVVKCKRVTLRKGPVEGAGRE